ncbi:MAG: nuclear transport factor 2 family protein [Cocleimonas sp.]
MTREEKFINFFSHLTANNLDEIYNVFSSKAHFKDPFNDVNGVKEINNVFNHMFATTEQPKFIVNHSAAKQEKLFIQWQFTFIKNKTNWSIDGSSMVTFDENDKVIEHIDYWDPAEQIYSKIGLLRPIMNFLKSRLTAS